MRRDVKTVVHDRRETGLDLQPGDIHRWFLPDRWHLRFTLRERDGLWRFRRARPTSKSGSVPTYTYTPLSS
jgi:hypothetical protein